MNILHVSGKSLITPVDKTANEEVVSMCSPWVLYYKEMSKLFEKDPEVSIDFDESANTINVKVDNQVKADALTKILPVSKVFGSVEIKVNVVPCNLSAENYARYIKDAFEGNGAFSHLTVVDHVPDEYISNPINYCVFKREVVQYGADDLSSESGCRSTLYENIARDVLIGMDGVFFCTDIRNE